MYNVFTDFHHSSLLNSLIMLFEGRLGGAVYRPIGMEWAEKGFWKVYDHPATQAQFLGIGSATPDGTPKLNEVEAWVGEGIGRSLPDDGMVGRATDATVYYCHDIESGATNKAITFDGFMHLPIDIIIASIPQHIEPFKKLSELHPNHPKLIYQIGNAWPIEANGVKNVMASAIVPNVPENVNFISYHQEFDLDTFYPQFNAQPNKNIFSFVNCFSIDGMFRMDWDLFTYMEKLMPEWNFKSFGGQCRDGSKNGSQELGDAMRDSRFIWHTKAGGDGYGHVLHNAAASGKPLIVRKSQYFGKMGDQLLIDGETCINIDNLAPEEIVEKIKYYDIPERYDALSNTMYETFKKVVDFDKEAADLQTFLKNLV